MEIQYTQKVVGGGLKVKWIGVLKNKFIVIKKDSNNEWRVYTKQYLKCDNNGNKIGKNSPLLGNYKRVSYRTICKNYKDSF